MSVRKSTLSLALAGSIAGTLVCGVATFVATGCSSSSSGSPSETPSGDDDSGSSTPDGGSAQDATVGADGGPSKTKDGGGDGSAHDAGSEAAVTGNASPSGEAGVAEFCAAGCSALQQCYPDAGACNPCSPGPTALYRTDFVDALSACIKSGIVADCADPMTVTTNCFATTTAAVSPTAAVAAFCKDVSFTLCPISDCEAQVSIYADPSISKAATCIPEVPDAAVDGGCNTFANCVGSALSQ
jgi:hypothetical protein